MNKQLTSSRELPNPADTVRASIENCEDEPIRIPGSIQCHGFLLLLNEEQTGVVAASENAPDFLKIPLNLILGASIDALLEREILAALAALDEAVEPVAQVTYLGSFPLRQELYSVATHLVEGQRVLEFERIERLVSLELMNAITTNFVSRIGRLSTEADLCRSLTREVKDLTGFHRVLLYTFDEAGHGTVIAEENDGPLPRYLGLRFPASDIPKQARELYIANTVRIIPNAGYVPSPIVGLGNRAWKTFDLSSSILRSVSPIHIEYMKNMGTMASMSISIVLEGRLWGLVSGHHAEQRTVPYVVRSTCDLLTKMAATQLISLRNAAELERAVHFHTVQRKLLTRIAAEKNYVSALMSQVDELSQVTDAAGSAFVIDGQCVLGGETPDHTNVLQLARWMDERPDLTFFETRHLENDVPWASEIRKIASGWLVVRISDVRQAYLMWFRPEVLRTITWAGEPVGMRDAQRSLHPRASFAAWQELVQGKSVPWSATEKRSAQEFRLAAITIGLKRAEEQAEIGESRFQELTHSLPNLVCAVDDSGHISYVNQKWRDSGLTVAGAWCDQPNFRAEDRDRCLQQWEAAVSTDSPFETEVRFQHLRGSEGLYLVRAVPFRQSNGVRAGWIVTFTDLTERRDREIALRIAEKLTLSARMTSVIAHEINNPLQALINIHLLLRQEVLENDAAVGYVRMALTELERISGITKQTIRWSKESSSQPDETTSGVLFDDVLRLLAAKLQNRNVRVDIEGRDVRLRGVVGQLRQVLANLVSNSIDALPGGGHIHLIARASGEEASISVEDNGTGMTEAVKTQLFEPFFTTKGDRGNGLGLYISQEIMERHRGKLVIESAAGVGTRVSMVLPVASSA